MAIQHYLACDLGAESGRLILGSISDQNLRLQELHRFPNGPVTAGASLQWNISGLMAELKRGLKKAATLNLPYTGISTDSWGVDYLLLDAQGGLIEPTYHYRDPRTQAGVDRVRAVIDWPTLFGETGIQFMPLNTIYQLAAESPDRLERTHQILLIADGFNFLMSGCARAEASLASTTQLYNPRTRSWSDPVLAALDLPKRLFPDIVPSGSRLGPLRPELAQESGLSDLGVIASCSHDTGAAVAAVPAEGDRSAYISSGTWSLMGVEVPNPILTDTCRELNFTNEIGYGGSVRLLKNISGLWLVQECRRHWAAAGRAYDYATLTRLASEATAFRSLVDPTDTRFLAPGDMPQKIAAFCRETHQPTPESEGDFVRCALESLALLYRRTGLELEQLTGQPIERLHIVGGGSQNNLLNQLAADAMQVPVLAGPVEATAAGNILVQALASGHLSSLEAGRRLIRASFPLTTFEPQDQADWKSALERFERLRPRG